MKRTISSLLIISLILILLAVACAESPGAIATLAPTASVPTASAAESIPVTGQPSEPSATQATAGEASVAPTSTPVPPPTETPTPTITPTPEFPPVASYEVLNTFPHDPNAWTQGLVMDNGILYEGTGQWGESDLRQVALESGAIIRSQPLEDQYFGEGITVFGDRIFQLTWQEGTGFIYDKGSFSLLETFTYPHEGWGITHDGQRLIVSDGTSTIRFWDPETLAETGRITVRDNSGPLNRLNELEYIDGEIWANIWLTDLIARINPETGFVNSYIDLTGLLDTSTLTQPADVLNGIAYDAAAGRILVTGKYWPALFEIQVVPGP